MALFFFTSAAMDYALTKNQHDFTQAAKYDHSLALVLS